MVKINFKSRYMYRISALILAFSLLASGVANAQTTPDLLVRPHLPTEKPTPLNLRPGWWDYFEVDEKIDEERVVSFTDSLQELEAAVSDDNRTEVEAVINKIKANFTFYLTAEAQPPIEEPLLTPIKERYRIEDIITLDNEIQNNRILLRTDREDYEELRNQGALARERYALLQTEYRATEPLSEKRLLLGLQMIDLRISSKLTELRRERLSQSIANDSEVIERLTAELEIAKNRLYSDAEGLQRANRRLSEAEEAWQAGKEELRQEEARYLTSYDFAERDEGAKLSNQMLSQKLMQAAIREAIAHNEFIFNQVRLELSRYLNFPDQVERRVLLEKSEDWRQEIVHLEQNIKDWELSTQRDIQRAEEWLSLRVEEENENAEDLRVIQREILLEAESSLFLLIRLKSDTERTEFLLGLVDRITHEEKGWLERTWQSFWQYLINALRAPGTWIAQPLFTVGDTVITTVSIIQFLVVLIITIWIARLLGTTVNRYAARRKDIKLSLLYRINRLFQYVIIAIGIFIALTFIGFDFTNLVLIAGALGVGLGFGLQMLFNNFVSGIVILFENQLKVGDYVELESGVCGEVREINVRSTYVKTNDGIAIMVPNSEFTTSRVINWTHKEPYRRVQIPFSVAYQSDKDLVKKVVKEAILNVPITLKKSWAPEPRVYIVDFGPSSIDFKVSVWVDDNATKRSSYTKSMYLWVIHDALTENNIKIPYPQVDLHVESVFDKTSLEEIKNSFNQHSE
jgi:potassium-dependent mechanosensitive channel